MTDAAGRTGFEHLPDDTLGEVLNEGRHSLQATVQLALGANQRGATLTGICGAGSIALFAAAAALAPVASVLAASLALSAVLLFAAAIIFGWSARPIDFYVAGYEPRLLAEATGDLTFLRRRIAADIQRRISFNRAALRRGALLVKIGLLVAGAAPAAGGALYGIMGSPALSLSFG